MSQRVVSVSALVHYIKQSLDNDLNVQSILIKGEISNFTNHRSGHWYFTLKDAKSKLSCVMFASQASRCKILLKEGMKVLVTASLSVYEAGGSMQLYVSNVQVDGIGDLFLQLEQVKQKLSIEGLFDATHKKAVPLYPMDIGVITAKTGAAIQDILTTIARRWPLATVSVYPSLVQGVQATEDIIRNLKMADEQQHDVILLARGGGAIEDLWCFNEESLARCVHAMKSVIVSGVGHESDTTLVDYVSDARGATPTAAAELITPDIKEVEARVQRYQSQLRSDMNNRLQQAKKELQTCREHRYIQNPLSYIASQQMQVAMHVKELGVVEQTMRNRRNQLQKNSHQFAILSERIKQESRAKLGDKETRFLYGIEHYRTKVQQLMKAQVTLLDAYSPLKILGRGYHIAYHEEHIVKSVQDIEECDKLTLRFVDGLVHTQITKKETL